MSRILIAATIIIATLGFVDGANANRANGKAGQRAICHDKIGAKHLSGDPMKAEWKKCMEDANAISDGSCAGRVRTGLLVTEAAAQAPPLQPKAGRVSGTTRGPGRSANCAS
jgi:hypothetical protein